MKRTNLKAEDFSSTCESKSRDPQNIIQNQQDDLTECKFLNYP